jgi:D-alanyl-D-alanine carboxypeptidase
MLPMRTTITIFFVSIFVIFILVIVSSSQSGLALEGQAEEGGRVLGVTDALIDEDWRQYRFEDLGFPEPEKITENVPAIKMPSRLEDSERAPEFPFPVYAFDVLSGKALYAKSADSEVPIASITKLMTALVAMENIKDFDFYYKIKASDMISGGRYYIQPGEEIMLVDLLQLSLIASANSATRALVSASGLEEEDFLHKMNLRAKDLGMVNSNFFDPVGISHYNKSSASEVAMLLKAVISNETLAEIIGKQSYNFSTKAGRIVKAYTTNSLLKKYPKKEISIQGGKTGHTKAAGYCLTSAFEKDNNRIITVVLGAQENYQRFLLYR